MSTRMSETVQSVILAGGSGTRLWPLSRSQFPKQLLNLQGHLSLLQATAQRIAAEHWPAGAPEVLRPLVVCHEEHRFLVAEQLREAGIATGTVLLEPCARNTAPALTAAATLVLAGGRDPVLLVTPADHLVADSTAYLRAVAAAVEQAADGWVMTLGITPHSAHPGFGYLRTGAPLAGRADAWCLEAFVEKPSVERAQVLLDSGDCLWNSGTLVVRASLWLALVQRFAADIASRCGTAVEQGGVDGDFFRPETEAFAASPSSSIDYGVMGPLASALANEHTSGGLPPCGVQRLDAGWSDIGSWAAVHASRASDATGNVVDGDVYQRDCRDSLVLATHRFVATMGLRNIVVVETADAVLVAERTQAEQVRDVVAHLEAGGRGESRTHRKVYRPWGTFERIDSGERFQAKRLTVKPGASLSLQLHRQRAEHWVVVRGTAHVQRGDERLTLQENESIYIPAGTQHRLHNPGVEPLEVIEVQTGGYLGEDDIVRLEDDYHR